MPQFLTRIRRGCLALGLGLLLRAVFPTEEAAAEAAVDAPSTAVLTCAALLREDFTRIPDAPTALLSTTLVGKSKEANEFCQVSGFVAPQIQFELRLPTGTWNGRYLQAGCSGLCGQIFIDQCADALAQDFAVAAQNMGHVGNFWSDPLWASERSLRRDFGRRSTHVVAVAMKAIIERFYGAPPAYAYFRGCSTGGREGLSEAQHFPGDFDGIVAGDPAFPGRLGAFANNWDARQLLDDNDELVFSQDDLKFLHDAVLYGCDGLDGLEDGIIEDPRNCRFDVSTLECAAGDTSRCLTKKQVAAAQNLYSGPRTRKGVRLYPGQTPFGSELAWDGANRRSIASAALRYLAFDEVRPDYEYRNFNFDEDVDDVEAQARIYDPVAPRERPDLSAFRRQGGKLIIYHGWADPGVPPEGTLDYYAKVVADEGGLDSVREWFRVFMIPGMYHCRGGAAPNTFDFLSAMIDWVEKGEVPDGIVATQFDGEKLVRTRPLYAYPTVARYKGTGDVDVAASWGPVAPAEPRDDNIPWLWAPKGN